jgi:hypothetical protein
MYSPRSPGPEYHSVVHPGGGKPRLEAFEVVPNGGFSRATFELPGNVTWTRAVSLVMLGADLPVIAVQDSFTGAGERTWQLNLMAEGPIETPEGPCLPGQTFAVPAGVTRLAVTGQTWPAHVTQGIDWDLYLVTAKPEQAEIGEWKHNWHPGTEQGQFQRANGRAFEERQYLLRVKGDGPFRAILVPYFKGQKPVDIAVSTFGDELVVASGGQSARFGPEGRITR